MVQTATAPSSDLREEEVRFASHGLRLAGVIHFPLYYRPEVRHPAFIVLNSLGRSMESGSARAIADQLALMGYIALRFDFRGTGWSEGEWGRIICLEQVADAQAALAYLADRDDVAAECISVIGDSLGGAVGLFTASVDTRVSAVICASGWGNGERKFRLQHASPDAWATFSVLLDAGRRQSNETPLYVSRYAIVPVPERLRRHFGTTDPREFPVETACSLFDFCPEDVVWRIAPRPVLLLHGAEDAVTPASESLSLFQRALPPRELHILTGADHFMFDEPNPRLWELIGGWLQQWCPVRPYDERTAGIEREAGLDVI